MTKSRWVFAVLFVLASQVSLADQACIDQCWADYDACVGPGCSSYWHCEQCDAQRDSCLNYCASCPTTREYTTSTITGTQATGRNGCYEDHIYFYSGKRYAEYRVTERRDTYRETTNCDGTKTTTLIGTGSISYYCWARDPIASCSNYAPNYLPICR
jgi:hypothetical protein